MSTPKLTPSQCATILLAHEDGWLANRSHLGGQGGVGPDLRTARALVRKKLALEVPGPDPRDPIAFRLTPAGMAIRASLRGGDDDQ